MRSALLWLPLLIPLGGGLAGLLLFRSPRWQKRVSLASAGLLLVAATALFAAVTDRGILVEQAGGWPAPFGITLVADLFTAILILLAAVMLAATLVSSLAGIGDEAVRFGFHPIVQFLVAAVCGAFLTGDLFNLYVWFEVMLMSSFVLLALGGGKRQLEGAIKYVALNLLASAMFLAAAGVTYGSVGTLNLADAALRLRALDPSGIPTVIAAMLFVAFGLKAAVFPLFFWLPASYHTPPPAVAALFAGLLTKVGVYAMIRVFTLLFVGDAGFTHGLILVVAALTMATGVLGAMVQGDVRRILAFHSVSQVGYMMMGLGLFTPLGLAGAIVFMVHHSVVKSNLFLIGGLMRRVGGSFSLDRLGGLYAVRPWLAGLFLLTALSLAGVPPLSGFWAKFVLVRAGIETGQWTVVAVSLAVSLLTLFSMTKIWDGAFWSPAPGGAAAATLSRREAWLLGAPAVVLLLLAVGMGVRADTVLEIARQAADQLMNPSGYIQTVLAGSILP